MSRQSVITRPALIMMRLEGDNLDNPRFRVFAPGCELARVDLPEGVRELPISDLQQQIAFCNKAWEVQALASFENAIPVLLNRLGYRQALFALLRVDRCLEINPMRSALRACLGGWN